MEDNVVEETCMNMNSALRKLLYRVYSIESINTQVAEFQTLYGSRSKLCNVNLELKQILFYNVITEVTQKLHSYMRKKKLLKNYFGQIFVCTNFIFLLIRGFNTLQTVRRLL